MAREDSCGTGKSAPAIMAKEMLILIGLQMGASMKVLSEIIGMTANVSSNIRVRRIVGLRRR
jgi:hypothetical protein